MIGRPQISPLFPSTSLFRSIGATRARQRLDLVGCEETGQPHEPVALLDRKRNSPNSHPLPLFPIPSFFFNDRAPTDLSTLPLHVALPIYRRDTRSPAARSRRLRRNRAASRTRRAH